MLFGFQRESKNCNYLKHCFQSFCVEKIMDLAESHSKTCFLSNNYCRCTYKLTPLIMSMSRWDLRRKLLFHIYSGSHGQGISSRGTEKMWLYVYLYFLHLYLSVYICIYRELEIEFAIKKKKEEKKKKQSHAFRKEMQER